jgi:diguanylate cyclase (GGDEF)-like protein
VDEVERAEHEPDATRPPGPGRPVAELLADLAADLQAAESGLEFVYRCLDRVVAEWQLHDAVIVIDRPPLGRQAFRVGRRVLDGGWAEEVALGGPVGLHTDPPFDDGGHLDAATDLVAVALRLDNLRYDSLHDPLTKLYNRRSFDDQLLQAVSRARRYDDPFTLVTIDLDLFKVVNDSYGHAGGDDVLRAIGAAMRHALRQSDVAARTGGDEFALILPGGDGGVVAPLIERLRDGVRALDRDLPVDFSVGLASCPSDADTVEALSALADTRLYTDKAKRRAERAERAAQDGRGEPPSPAR